MFRAAVFIELFEVVKKGSVERLFFKGYEHTPKFVTVPGWTFWYKMLTALV